MQPKVSVIIPVYKAEKYIEQCVRSLFEQTLDSIEYVFVDDCSPDNSIQVMQEILEEYPNRKPQVILIRHEMNKGVGQTRQDGIDVATGEYIIHCDPDDWVDTRLYLNLYDTAINTKADIIICDYEEVSQTSSHTVVLDDINRGKDLFREIVNHRFHASFWNKLISAKLKNIYRIPHGINIWEDLCMSPL